jgi:uncharacterized protein (TIGR02996 family)
MSRQEDALIAAVCAAPEDDTPRLVCADWLDENGQTERAELIRVEVAIERLPADDPQRRALVWRARELHYHHERAFGAGLPRAVQRFTCHFRRGFVARVCGSVAAFLKAGAALVRHFPLEQADLSDLGGRVADLAAAPALGSLRGLRLDGNEDPGAVELLDSPLLGWLAHLDLDCAALDAAGAARLAGKDRLAQLTSLHPGRLEPSGLRALLRSPHLANLTSLDLQTSDLGAAGVGTLTQATQLGRLTCLNLSYASLGRGWAERLAAWPRLGELTELRLRSCLLGDAGLRRLAAGSRVPRLAALDLFGNGLTPGCVEALLSWPGLDGLTELNLSGNEVGPAALRKLLSSPRLAHLTRLSALGVGAPEEVARVLAEAPGLDRLHTIDVDLGLHGDSPETALLHQRFSPWAFCGALWQI